MSRGVALAVGMAAAMPLDGAAQEGPPRDSLTERVGSLEERIDSLSALLERLRQERETVAEEDELDALRAAAEAAAASVPPDDTQEGDEEFVGRQRSLQALNPEISVNADFFAFSDPDDPDANNFVPREFEFSFQSSLDPFSRAKIFLAYHTPGGELEPFEGEDGHGHEEEGEEGGLELEEAYLEWVSLPGGLSLKLGKIFQQLGTLNRWHSHALPFQTRSLPHLAFIGEENLSQAGGSVRALLPIGGSGAYEATVELTRSSNGLLYGESNQLSYLAHINAFWQLAEAWDLDVGVSATGGPFREGFEDEPVEGEPPAERVAFDRRLYAAETSLTWRPPERALYRGVNLRSGVMLNAPTGLDALENAWGAWVWGEVRVGRQWLLGGRYEWVQQPANPDESASLIAPTLTWWQSEWVRVRAEFDHLMRPTDTQNLFLLQFTFALGPHKHETY